MKVFEMLGMTYFAGSCDNCDVSYTMPDNMGQDHVVYLFLDQMEYTMSYDEEEIEANRRGDKDPYMTAAIIHLLSNTFRVRVGNSTFVGIECRDNPNYDGLCVSLIDTNHKVLFVQFDTSHENTPNLASELKDLSYNNIVNKIAITNSTWDVEDMMNYIYRSIVSWCKIDWAEYEHSDNIFIGKTNFEFIGKTVNVVKVMDISEPDTVDRYYFSIDGINEIDLESMIEHGHYCGDLSQSTLKTIIYVSKL